MKGGRGDAELGTQPNNNEAQPQSIAASALNLLRRPFAALSELTSNGSGGIFGDASPNVEISRLSLQYSSGNQSEEESSSLINILNRKKYNERLAATRSADDQTQPR